MESLDWILHWILNLTLNHWIWIESLFQQLNRLSHWSLLQIESLNHGLYYWIVDEYLTVSWQHACIYQVNCAVHVSIFHGFIRDDDHFTVNGFNLFQHSFTCVMCGKTFSSKVILREYTSKPFIRHGPGGVGDLFFLLKDGNKFLMRWFWKFWQTQNISSLMPLLLICGFQVKSPGVLHGPTQQNAMLRR